LNGRHAGESRRNHAIGCIVGGENEGHPRGGNCRLRCRLGRLPGARRAFAGGAAPAVTDSQQKQRTQEMCFPGCAVLHSAVSRKPLYSSAEHLTRINIEAARRMSRKDSYHPEATLPVQDQMPSPIKWRMPLPAAWPVRRAEAPARVAPQEPWVRRSGKPRPSGMARGTTQCSLPP
jgi:hypothetical protein